MRRYWSVILLGARGVVGKLLLLLLALTAAEAALVAVFAGYTVILPHILNFSHLSLAFRAASLARAAPRALSMMVRATAGFSSR